MYIDVAPGAHLFTMDAYLRWMLSLLLFSSRARRTDRQRDRYDSIGQENLGATVLSVLLIIIHTRPLSVPSRPPDKQGDFPGVFHIFSEGDFRKVVQTSASSPPDFFYFFSCKFFVDKCNPGMLVGHFR